MSVVKSDLIRELADAYPNFLRKDLLRLVDITLYEIQTSLKSGEGVELRGFGTFRTNIQKESIRRNPKTGTKINVPKKRTIKWKMSKDLFKKLNNEKE